MSIVKRLNLYEDKTWSVWAKFQFSASPQTLPAIALNHIQTDRCDSVNTGVQLNAFRQSCFPLTIEMNWNWSRGTGNRPKKNTPGQNYTVFVFLLNIWTYPDRWMLVDKPFNYQVSEKVFWVPQLTRTWKVNNFLMIKKKHPIDYISK